MRLFIALEPGAEFLESLMQSLLPLKEKYPYFRWVPRENLHITLVFLGELDEGVLPQIKTAAEAASGCGEIAVTGGKLFTLPPRKDANVLALGFEKGGEEIASLAAGIKNSLRIHGITPGGTERGKFMSHITVARKGREPVRLLNEDTHIQVHGVFNAVKVYKSELLKTGARYTVLAAYP